MVQGVASMGTPKSTKQSEVIHDSEWITVWYHPDGKIIHHRFHKAIRGEAFRSALLAGTAVLLKHRAKKWLSDDRLVFILPQEDQEWAQSEWFPRTLGAGWQYWAIAKPEKAVVDLYIRRLAATYSAAGVLTELFTTPEAGMAWLLSQGNEAAPTSQP
jgi:hypothetical protein